MGKSGERKSRGSQLQWAKLLAVITILMLASLCMMNGFAPGTVSAGDQPPAKPEVTCPYTNNAAAIAEGKKLFNKNCAECHGDGTGGSGPDLTDNEWLCGGSDYQIFVTILKGRPGGMPSWSGDLKDDEVWKIIAYIRSLKK
jgi:cytochrome c oxidase cbb3-type subunit 3